MPEPTRINCACINPDCGSSMTVERVPGFNNPDLVHIDLAPDEDITVSRTALLEALREEK